MKELTDVRCTYVRTVDDVMAIKPNFLASMGYQYFLMASTPGQNVHLVVSQIHAVASSSHLANSSSQLVVSSSLS